MRILYISQYFPPEAGATQIRAFEMARNFVSQGHEVTVITEIPNHPSGIFPPSYQHKLYERVELEGIDVIRVWVKTSTVKNFLNRMVFYLSFMINAILAGLLLTRNSYDLIYASSPPLFVGGSALVLSYIKSTPLVFEVRDLWPESAVQLGEISSKRAIAWATRLEEACYNQANKIIVVNQGIKERLIEDHFQDQPVQRSSLRKELHLENKFIISYTGNLGVAYSFNTVFKAAKILRDDPSYHFLIIGDGPKKADIATLLLDNDTPNLTLLPEQSYDAIPRYYSASDVIIIPMRRNKYSEVTVPVKIFDAWACQRPVLLCNVEGEASQIISEANAGLVIPPEDVEHLVTAVRRLQDSPDLCKQMGINGRTYTVENFSRKRLADKLLSVLETITQD
jgi:glycosyltransferase involved in cell wall biosynthesis